MNKLLVLCCVMFAAGCSSAIRVTSATGDNSISSFNRFVYGRQGTITLEQDSVTIVAVGIRATEDSLIWNDEQGRRMSATLANVHEVACSDATRGRLEGLGLGLLAGAGTGALATLIFASPFERDGIIIIATPGGALIGTVIGGFAGNAQGHSFRYSFRK